MEKIASGIIGHSILTQDTQHTHSFLTQDDHETETPGRWENAGGKAGGSILLHVLVINFFPRHLQLAMSEILE